MSSMEFHSVDCGMMDGYGMRHGTGCTADDEGETMSVRLRLGPGAGGLLIDHVTVYAYACISIVHIDYAARMLTQHPPSRLGRRGPDRGWPDRA